MAIVDNVSIDVTSSALDQLVPLYCVATDHHPIPKMSPRYEIVQFPDFTHETQQSGIIRIGRESLEMANFIDLPVIQTLGRARLKVRNVSRLSPPSYD